MKSILFGFAGCGVLSTLLVSAAIAKPLAQPLEVKGLGISGQGQIIAQAPPNVDCANPTSNIEYKYCARIAYEASDRELNRVYKQVTARMNPEQKRILVNAQLAWIKYRDNGCDAEVYLSRGGTGYEGFRNGCLERVTKARTAELIEQFAEQR
jgi:uncharacterized protein YecT (DUF1311 family)